MRAKKSLGQHFLKSEKALATIVKSGELRVGDTVLEIGPGQGALTEKLLGTKCRVLAVEKDDNLYEFLKEKFKTEIKSGQLNLIHDDILNFDPESYNLEASTYKLVANIPYNITGAILKKFLSAKCQPERMVLLVQKEVAERIIVRKKPLDSARGKESILSISVKVYGNPRYVETVKAGSFAPMPCVDSAIITIENISKTFFKTNAPHVNTPCLHGGEEKFFELVRAGFKSKRKKLSSNLVSTPGVDKDMVAKVFKELNLDDNLRAEDVSIETWRELMRLLCKFD